MASTLGPARLAQSLAAAAKAEGVVALVQDRLASSERRPSPEIFMQALEALLTDRLVRHTHRAGEHAAHWMHATVVAPLLRSTAYDDLQKAQRGLGLTPAQLDELRRLIEAHFHVPLGIHPVEWTIPPEIWDRWQAQGIVIPGIEIPEIESAWTAGRLYQVIEAAHTYEQMLRLARQHIPSRQAQHTLAWAQASAARAISSRGVRLGAQAVDQAMTVHRHVARNLIEQYLQGALPRTAPARGLTHDLTPLERRVLSTDRMVDSWRGLASELRRQFRSSDHDRDWARVAATETRTAYNVGRISALTESQVPQVIFLVQPDACHICRTLLLNPDGTPKVFSSAFLLDQIAKTGGQNVGRKASKLGDPDLGPVVTGGVLHPWCRCRPIPYVGTLPWPT
jgi:hypothetical protein